MFSFKCVADFYNRFIIILVEMSMLVNILSDYINVDSMF